MKTEEQITTEFKKRVRNRRNGFEAAQKRVRNEICAERRRERFVLISIPRPLRAAAALLILGTGTFFAWQLMHRRSEPLLCPHSAKAEPPTEKSPYIANEESEIFNPELYDRICYCAPRYSGSLR